MKRLLAAATFALLCAQAHAVVTVRIVYTPKYGQQQGGDANAQSTLQTAFDQAVGVLNNSGVTPTTMPLQANIGPGPKGMEDDSVGTQGQAQWEATSKQAWDDRSSHDAGPAITVSLPPNAPDGTADAGWAPVNTPVHAKDATAAINGDPNYLTRQMLTALVRVLGGTAAQGLSVRTRTYNNGNQCYHTITSAILPISTLVPWLTGYTLHVPNGAAYRGPTAAQTCAAYFSAFNLANPALPATSYANENPQPYPTVAPYYQYTCTVRDAANAIRGTSGNLPFSDGTGSAQVDCGGNNLNNYGEVEVPNYISCTATCPAGSYNDGNGYVGPLGQTTYYDQAKQINDNYSNLFGMHLEDATNAKNAAGGFWASLLRHKN